jgi:endonuclease/exonuclease/phosphatase family metal-dependent hydrolase
MNRIRVLAALACAAGFCLSGCAAVLDGKNGGLGRENPETFTAAVWNLQALFDGEEAGNEYNDYRASAGWTGEKYAARINAFGRAIGQMGNAGSAPDFIGLVEIENVRVVEDLARAAGRERKWTCFAGIPGMSLGVGAISRYPLTETRVHSITSAGETAPRPMLEARVEVRDRTLVFFVCHWKSKIGDSKTTEALRRASARIIRRRLREIRSEEPETPVIIMGDLNESYDEFYRLAGTTVSALLPDDPAAADLADSREDRQDFLVLSGEKPPRSRFFDPAVPVLYTPWKNELTEGSYYYKNNWETIDHFLLTGELFNGKGWEFSGCRVLNQPPFAGASGQPEPYTLRNGQGLSDHLPLLLTLKMASPGSS